MNRRQAKKDFRNRTQADFDKSVYRSGYDAAVREVLEIINSVSGGDIGEINNNPEGRAYADGYSDALSFVYSLVHDLQKGGENGENT